MGWGRDDEGEHGLQSLWLGGQEFGIGDEGQVVRAFARASAGAARIREEGVWGVCTSMPEKALRKVRCRCDVMSSASEARPAALETVRVVEMDS